MSDPSRLNRGRITGILLMLLGAWGALVPFLGHYFGFEYTPDKAWAYTSGRLWLSIVPGAAAFVGGLLITLFARTVAVGGLLAALGGAWFILGQSIIAVVVTNGSITAGSPVTTGSGAIHPATMRLLEGLGFFYGVGTVIVFVAALALGKVMAGRAAASAYMDEPVEPAAEPQYHGAS
jgi:hypothetical protein